jgi:ribonuclease BN (tRNA processing enzyme)
MRIYTVGTGSSGNCYLLKHNDNYIALDCGCKWKDVLVGCNFHPIDIDFALVTHSHSDHSKYAKEFIKGGIPVYSPDNVKAKTMVKYKDISFVPFVVPHDVPCYGYLIKVDGRTIVYMTDFGYCRYTFKSWNVDTFIIACNYNILPDAEDAKYAHVVLGHSSLDTVKDILAVNKCDALKNVILCHVSADADTEQMVTEVKEVVGDGVNVSLAKKGTVIYL